MKYSSSAKTTKGKFRYAEVLQLQNSQSLLAVAFTLAGAACSAEAGCLLFNTRKSIDKCFKLYTCCEKISKKTIIDYSIKKC